MNLKILLKCLPFITLLFTFACSGQATTGNATLGQSLYFNNCAVCHGVAPNLDANAKNSANNGNLVRSSINSVNVMKEIFKGPAALSVTQTNDIAAYIGTVVSGGSSSGGGGGGTPTATVVPTFNPTDLWYVPAESGWGLMSIQRGNTVIFAIYNYDASRNPLWFLTAGPWITSTQFSGALAQYTGSPFNSIPFIPNTAANATTVGTLTFTMLNNDNATLVYTVNGVTVTKAVTRFIF